MSLIQNQRVFRDVCCWRILPNGNVAIVQQEPNLNWTVVSDYDYYVWKDFRWRGVDIFGMLEFLRDEKLIDFGVGWKKIFYKGQWIKADIVDFFAFIEETCPVLIGRWALSTEYSKILQLTENDREFGVKNGYLQAERIPGRRR